jgi:large subunit ribosomal protein L16
MKTQPKSRTYLKPHRPKLGKLPFVQHVQSNEFPVFTLVSLESKLLTIGQIEAARKSILRMLKTNKNSRLLLRISPTFPRTCTPLETRMGSGKGAVDSWVASIRTGTILFEITRIDEQIAREAFKKAIYKLPGRYVIETRYAASLH